MSVIDNAALNWNGYEVYPVSQPVPPNGLNHAIRSVPQASAQGNVVLPMAVTYPAPQVAIPNVGYIHPVNVIRPCWPRPVATNGDTRLHGMCTVQPAAVHKQTGVLPLSVSSAGAASTIGSHSVSPLPPGSACVSRSDGFPLNQAAADTVSPSASCQQDNNRYHAMKSEGNARGLCQVSERASLPPFAPALVPLVRTQVDVSQPTQTGTAQPKPVLMSIDSLSALNIAVPTPYSAFRGSVGLTVRHRSPSLGHSLSSIPLGSSLSQLWASQNHLLTPLSSINSVSNLKGEVKFPTLEAQYYGGSLPDLSLGTLQRLLPSTPNVAGSNGELHRGTSGLLYLIPSQGHLPPKTPVADEHGSESNSPNHVSASHVPPQEAGQWPPRCAPLSSNVGGGGTEMTTTVPTTSPLSTSPHSVLSRRSPVSLPSPPLSPEGADPPPHLSEITQFKMISPESSVAQSCSLSPPNCQSPVAQPILHPIVPGLTLAPFQKSSSHEPLPVDCSARVSLPVNGNLPYVYSVPRPQPVALPPYGTNIANHQQLRQNDFSADDPDGLPLEKKFKMAHEPSVLSADYDTGSPGSDHLVISMHNGEEIKKEKPHVCDYPNCGRSFTFPAHLKSHIQQTHICHRPCECDFEGCGKRFYTPQHLTVHRRVHTGERPFVCPYEDCRKAFTTAGNLKNHIRTHTGERPYACKYPTCERRFAEMSSLRKHELTHTGEKPYACRMCSKKFSQAGSRNTHERRHNKAQLHADSPTK